MAAVLPSPREKGHLSPDRVHRSPIKSYYLHSPNTDPKLPEARYYETDGSSSVSSSTTGSSGSTPPEVTYTSFPFPSSETATISLYSSEDGDDEDHEMAFPSFDTEDYFNQGKELDPPVSEVSDTQSTTSPVTSSFQDEPQFDPSSIPKCAGDDNSIEDEPTTQVDYLSHDWKEEEVWASWKYVTSKKDRFNDAVRLENASWRAWSKSKDNLKIISPESLGW
jgi:hypothetical protein